MAIELNSSALDAYRQLQVDDKKAILNMNKERVTTKGSYKGALSALSRTEVSKEENNRARTALLKALGRAFNIKGMVENNGKVTFSKEFMDRLEKLIGKDFKRSDFGINAAGEVMSGRPLTMRRVEAIVKKADFVGAGRFDVAVYERKLNHMMKQMGVEKWDLAKLEKEANVKREYQTLVHLIKTMEYLKQSNSYQLELTFDYQAAIENYDLDFEDGKAPEEFDESTYNGPRYQYHDTTTGEMKTSRTIEDWQLNIQKQTGLLFHQENAYSKSPSKIDYLNSYTVETYKLYVKKNIDIFFACQEAGKVQEFKDHLRYDPGVCVEGRIDQLNRFENQHLIQKSAEDIREAAEIERIAKALDNNGKVLNTDTLIFNEIEAAMNKGDADFDSSWEDLAPTVKQNLVGKMAVIVTVVPSENDDGVDTFTPVMKDGKPETRPLTVQDIDLLGPACLKVVVG